MTLRVGNEYEGMRITKITIDGEGRSRIYYRDRRNRAGVCAWWLKLFPRKDHDTGQRFVEIAEDRRAIREAVARIRSVDAVEVMYR